MIVVGKVFNNLRKNGKDLYYDYKEIRNDHHDDVTCAVDKHPHELRKLR
jgi:hypothetical protein